MPSKKKLCLLNTQIIKMSEIEQNQALEEKENLYYINFKNKPKTYLKRHLFSR